MTISAAALSACSLILKDTQCATDGDCGKKGGSYAGSVCRDGACTFAASTACTTNTACGVNQVCNHKSGACVSLTSVDCTRVVGDPSNDRAIILGSILKMTGPDLGGSPSIRGGIEYALGEIKSAAGGLPDKPGGDPRPIVLVECDQVVNPLRAAHYLVDAIGVSAIIGASNSGTTTDIATQVTDAAKVLLMSPTSTSPSLTNLSDDGYVWRASPSDTLQGNAMALVYPSLEAKVVAANPSAQGKVRVALAAKGDAYGDGLRRVLVDQLTINGAKPAPNTSFFLSREYPNTDVDANYDFAPDIDAFSAFRPDVMILAGTGEALAIMRGLEAPSGGATPLAPLYLLSDGLVNPDTAALTDEIPSLRDRILGFIPANPKSDAYRAFRDGFTSSHDFASLDPINAAFGYDSLYLVAYAIVASHGADVSGTSIRDGLIEITGNTGIQIAFGLNEVNEAIADLLADKQIQVEGASGPLDFDPATGDTVDDIDVEHLCTINGKTAWTSSGLLYDAVGRRLTDSITNCN